MQRQGSKVFSIYVQVRVRHLVAIFVVCSDKAKKEEAERERDTEDHPLKKCLQIADTDLILKLSYIKSWPYTLRCLHSKGSGAMKNEDAIHVLCKFLVIAI